MQRRRAIDKHGMLANHFRENVPDLGVLALDHLFRLLDGRREPLGFESGVDERLEKLERHFLWQPDLVKLQLRTNHNDGATGIIDALAEKVLAEAPLLALEHVGERLERTLGGPDNGASTPAVIEQGIDGLLEHALLVAHNDVGSAQLHKATKAVVAVDDATIEIVQIRRCEASAVQRHERPQVRRQDGNDGQYHPFRTIAGFDKVLNELQALDDFLLLGISGGGIQLIVQLEPQSLKVKGDKQITDGFGADARGETPLAVSLLRIDVFLFAEKLV